MTVTEIYQDISQRITESIAEKWKSAKLYIDRLDNYISVHGDYINDGGNETKINQSRFG